jgi:hypothetical protein
MDTVWIGSAAAALLFLIVVALIWKGGAVEGFQAPSLGVNSTIVCPQLKLIQAGTRETIDSARKNSASGPAGTNSVGDTILTQQVEMDKLYQKLIEMLKC